MLFQHRRSSEPSTPKSAQPRQQNRNQSFTYDNVARLKTASGWSTWSQSYGYDNKNNLTSVSGTQPKTVSVDSATNRIQNVNGALHSYDPAGNLTTDGIHNYKYDAAGRLATLDAGTGNEVSYYYDLQNWRVKKVSTGNTTNYIWEEGRVIAEYSSGPPQGPGGIKYYHPDRLSTRASADSGGAVISTQDHLPFGEDISSTGQPEKHRFTSYERDSESNTDHAMNRQYSMGSGRFMQADAWSGSTSNPQSLNRYAYVGSDPINSVDPEGLFPIISFSFGNFQMNVQAQYDPIVLIPSAGVGPIGPGPLLPVISIDVLSLPQQTPVISQKRLTGPCAGYRGSSDLKYDEPHKYGDGTTTAREHITQRHIVQLPQYKGNASVYEFGDQVPQTLYNSRKTGDCRCCQCSDLQYGCWCRTGPKKVRLYTQF